ncbi:tetratricopeptide repeat protein [Streptomyces sp. NPDC049577]|uniref:tetratricopeptide repeat protein n=1 Tax=Streptomyces sp. NPDC049577 TaxID=3155153 RepID=UPI00342877BF
MDPFTTSAVLAAVDTATTGALSGAAQEMGRRSAEALAGFLRRMRGRDAEAGEPAAVGEPAAPVGEDERRALAERLVEHARREPGFARELAGWLRETGRLGPHAPQAVAPAASRPRLLPPVTAAFTDRESILAEITALLTADRPAGAPAIALLHGPAGIGKSETAAHCAHTLKERFPDAQLYIDLAGDSSQDAAGPSAVLTEFLGWLGVPGADIPPTRERQTALYRSRTAGLRTVVVLDNAHGYPQIAPLLAGGTDSLVIVTSRRPIPELVHRHGALPLRVGPLSTADSLRLLARIAGADRVARRRTSAEAVVERCGGVPLALAEVAALAALREDGAGLETVAGELAASRREQETDGPVERTTDLAYRALAPATARLYRLLGVRRTAVTVAHAAAAAGIANDEARARLRELAAAGLLREAGDDRYRVHDAVRRHARLRARAEDGHAAIADAVRRTVERQLDAAAAADFLAMPLRWRLGPAYRELSRPADWTPAHARRALAELRRERENLAEAVRAAGEYGFDDLVWQLCEAMWALHLMLGFHQQWVDTHRRGVAAARREAARTGDRRPEARTLVQLAFAHLGLGQYAEAEEALAEAAAADESAGHRRGRATAVETLGLVRLRQWRYAEAEDCFRTAQDVLREIEPDEDGAEDVPRALALLERHIARALAGQDRYAAAEAQFDRALIRIRALPGADPHNEGRVHMNLGEMRLRAGDPGAARASLADAFTAMRAGGAGLLQADAAEMCARCARALGDAAEEERWLREARSLYEESEVWSGVARVDAQLAELAGD